VYFGDVERTPEELESFIGEAIAEFTREFGGRKPYVTVAVSGPETALRTFEMPELKGQKLASAVAFEAKKQLPFPTHDCYFDYRVVSKLQRDGQTRLRISLLAVTRRLVQSQLDYFRRLNISVNRVVSSYDVIGTLLPLLPEHRANDNFALINVERNGTHISYYRGDNLEFYHITSLGSMFLRNRTDDTRFENFAELMAREIQNSLDYYTGQFSTHFTKRIYIYGDMSYTEELITFLHEHFGFEFKRFPAESLKGVNQDNADLSFTMPVCLATVAATVVPVRLANLLPSEQLVAQKNRYIDRMAIAALVLLGLTLGYTSLVQYSSLGRIDSRIAGIQEEIATFEQSDIFDTYRHLQRENQRDQNYVRQIQAQPSYLGFNLKELSRVTPETVTLHMLELTEGDPNHNLHLYGVVRSGTVPPELILAEYVEDLNNSSFYSHVTVDRHVKRTVDDAFEVEFSLSMRGEV
jgi:Tfp pilus assembly PilM family ATPase